MELNVPVHSIAERLCVQVDLNKAPNMGYFCLFVPLLQSIIQI